MQFGVVKGSICAHELWQADRSKVTDGDLVLGGVLNDLTAQVGALDGSKILLVRFGVAMILEHHVGCSSFNLTLNDSLPKLLGLDGLRASTFLFISGIELFKLFTVALMQAWCTVWAEEGPVTVFLDSLHE